VFVGSGGGAGGGGGGEGGGDLGGAMSVVPSHMVQQLSPQRPHCEGGCEGELLQHRRCSCGAQLMRSCGQLKVVMSCKLSHKS